MNISWNGFGSVVLNAKIGQEDVTLVTNPFVSVGGTKFPKQIAASIIVSTHVGDDAENIEAIVPEHEGDKNPFHVVHAGEYEVRGMFVTSISTPRKDGTAHTIYRFDAENIHIGFLGALDRPLSSKEIDELGPIDILFVPAGGGSVLGASAAAQVTAEIEPRIVIPMYVSASEDDGLADSAAFVREVAVPSETVTKFKAVRAALPEEEMRMVILSRG